MKRMICILWSLVCVYTPVATGAEDMTTTTLRAMYTAQSGYQPDELQMISRIFRDLSGIEVEINYVDYEEQYQQIVESTSTYDIVSLDQIWVADLATKGTLTPLDEHITRQIRTDIEPAILRAFRYQKKIWAFPYLVNFQLFFYNQEMLEEAGFLAPPKTLEEMVEQMILLKEDGIVQYPWSDAWRQGEGLICEYVWLTAAFGGELFDGDGWPVFDRKPGVEALEFMVMLLDEQLASPDILTNDAIAAKDAFIAGDAAFTSNWVFMQGFLNGPKSLIEDQGKMGLLPVTEGDKQDTVSVSGFQGIGISADSVNKEAAWQWITFFTSPLVQRAYLVEMPVWTSVQSSDDVKMLVPDWNIKQTQLRSVIHRPRLENYTEVSAILQKYIYAALERQMEPSDALKQATEEVKELLGLETEEK